MALRPAERARDRGALRRGRRRRRHIPQLLVQGPDRAGQPARRRPRPLDVRQRVVLDAQPDRECPTRPAPSMQRMKPSQRARRIDHPAISGRVDRRPDREQPPRRPGLDTALRRTIYPRRVPVDDLRDRRRGHARELGHAPVPDPRGLQRTDMLTDRARVHPTRLRTDERIQPPAALLRGRVVRAGRAPAPVQLVHRRGAVLVPGTLVGALPRDPRRPHHVRSGHRATAVSVSASHQARAHIASPIAVCATAVAGGCTPAIRDSS